MRDVVYELSRMLSPRESQVFGELLLGRPNKVIARNLCIEERTVKFHCSNIYRKLNINNRQGLITFFS
jgi:DNA-binding NarL/FixJ family response regulator